MTDTPNDEGGSDQGPTLDDWRELAAKDLKGRDPESLTWHFEDEVGELASAGFTIEKQAEAFPITRIYDVGVIVYHLKAIPWEVPDFSVEGYRDRLLDLHRRISEQGYLDITSHRAVIVATKPE